MRARRAGKRGGGQAATPGAAKRRLTEANRVSMDGQGSASGFSSDGGSDGSEDDDEQTEEEEPTKEKEGEEGTGEEDGGAMEDGYDNKLVQAEIANLRKKCNQYEEMLNLKAQKKHAKGAGRWAEERVCTGDVLALQGHVNSFVQKHYRHTKILGTNWNVWTTKPNKVCTLFMQTVKDCEIPAEMTRESLWMRCVSPICYRWGYKRGYDKRRIKEVMRGE